jgi:hypothetical protein
VHRAALLHYISANGFESYRQKTPENAVEIAKILLDSGAEVDALDDTYDKSTTLGLVATSGQPKKAGVQIGLMEKLLDHGATIDGAPRGRSPLISAAAQAGEFLARRGARLDLEGAAGVGRLDVVERFCNEAHATRAQMNAGFRWACEYGRTTVVEFLLQKGVDMRVGENTG